MEPDPQERCICQICTCGRHRCRRHPQQETLNFDGELSKRQSDYVVANKPIERPVIKKLQDNLQVAGLHHQLEAKPTLRTDYPEFEVKRPIIHRLKDQLQLTSNGDEYNQQSVSNRDYKQFSVERPVIRRLQSSLKIAPGSMEPNQSLSQDTYREMPVSRPKRHLLPDNLTSQGDMAKTGHNHDDYRQFKVERPIIKKLQDNLTIGNQAKFDTQPTTSDYAEHADYSKPIRKKMQDTLTFSGPMEASSQSRKDYVEFHAERPIIKKLQDNIPVRPLNGNHVHEQPQSTQRDYGPVESRRPIINRLHDNLKTGQLEGSMDMQTAYGSSYVHAVESHRPEIKRMHSTLALGRGDIPKESVIKTDFPEHQVSRPVIMKPVGQLQSHDSSWNNGARNYRRRTSQEFGIGGMSITPAPSMNRVRQMESSIQFGSPLAAGPMMSLAQETFVPLEGAQRSRMTRPRTSNRLQEQWTNDPSMRNRNNVQPAMQNRDQQPATAPLVLNDSISKSRNNKKKHQVTDSTVEIGQPNGHHHMNGNGNNSLYKKSYTLPALDPCPASVLHVDDKSRYKFTRELHNHRFYKPIDVNSGA